MLRGQSLNSRGGAGGCQGQNISHETKFRFSDFFHLNIETNHTKK
jgi:hypothetical protein